MAPIQRDAAHLATAGAAPRALPRARRQVDLAPRPDPGRARGRPHAGHAACSKARTCCARPRRCARWAPASSAAATASGRVEGVGVGGLAEPDDVLDLGNSGTGARLLMGARGDAIPSPAFFTGDASLRRRPMARGRRRRSRRSARASSRATAAAAARRDRRAAPMPMTYRLPVPSAQVKSAVLLAGLNAPGETSVDGAGCRRATTASACCAISAPRSLVEP